MADKEPASASRQAAARSESMTLSTLRGDWRTAGPRTRLAVVLGVGAIASRFALEALGILTASWSQMVARVPDDTFYYLQIGRRLARGEGSTFDGINETNGFHPLWQFAVSLVSRFVSGDLSYLRASLLLALAATGVAAAVVVVMVWRLAGPVPAVGGMALAVHVGTLQTYSGSLLSSLSDGMESAALVLAVVCAAFALQQYARCPAVARAAAVGVLCGLVVLSRLDYIVVAIGVGAALWWWSRRLADVVAWATGFAAVGIPALSWWILSFDRVTPVSAEAKQVLQGQWLEATGRPSRLSVGYVIDFLERLARYPTGIVRRFLEESFPVGPRPVGLAIASFVLVLALLGGRIVVRSWRAGRPWWARSTPDHWSVGVVVGLVGLKAMLDVWLAPLWAGSWYANVQRVVLVVGISTLAWIAAVDLFRRTKWRGIAAVGLLAVLCLPVGVESVTAPDTPTDNGFQSVLDDAADFVIERGPSGRYGGRDSGLLGYRLDGTHQLVNLDGLVNGRDVVALLRDGAPLGAIARQERVDLLITRLNAEERRELSCATELWRSRERGYYSLDQQWGHVHVLDLRTC